MSQQLLKIKAKPSALVNDCISQQLLRTAAAPPVLVHRFTWRSTVAWYSWVQLGTVAWYSWVQLSTVGTGGVSRAVIRAIVAAGAVQRGRCWTCGQQRPQKYRKQSLKGLVWATKASHTAKVKSRLTERHVGNSTAKQLKGKTGRAPRP